MVGFFFSSRCTKIKIERGKNKVDFLSPGCSGLGFRHLPTCPCLTAGMERSQGERAVQAAFRMQI